MPTCWRRKENCWPYKCCPRSSAVQTIKVENNGAFSESSTRRRLLSGKVCFIFSSKQPHQLEQLFNSLEIHPRKRTTIMMRIDKTSSVSLIHLFRVTKYLKHPIATTNVYTCERLFCSEGGSVTIVRWSYLSLLSIGYFGWWGRGWENGKIIRNAHRAEDQTDNSNVWRFGWGNVSLFKCRLHCIL